MIKVGIVGGKGYTGVELLRLLAQVPQVELRTQGGDTFVILSAIDNLVKGAANQAVQNLNIMFDLPEATALNVVPLLP